MMIKNILVAGANGLVGKQLVSQLCSLGHNVSILSRKPANLAGVKVFLWDVYREQIDEQALVGVDTIINLAGEAIADKAWTPERKQQIINSRVKSTELLFKTVKKINAPVKYYISASAVGYYGDRSDLQLDEDTSPGNDFLSACCIAWEHAADLGLKLGINVVKLRTGIVLSAKGGALPAMMTPIKLFAGTSLGNGKQWMPWIHIDDLCAIYLYAVAEKLNSGSYNATAPNPLTNKEFTKELAHQLHRPVWPFGTPSYLLKLLLGERSKLVLMSTNTSAEKLEDAGFTFEYKTLDKALKDILVINKKAS